jgi:uncharacterized caspase-like protein
MVSQCYRLPLLRHLLLVIVLGWVAGGAAVVFAQTSRPAAGAEQRIALVIGNATYRVDPLENSVNDARLVARALTESQFKVSLHTNVDRRGLLEAIRKFGSQLNEDTVAVFYYAGHGLQLRDRNYLIPVDADIQSQEDIPITGMDIGHALLDRMSNARSRINIVIIDACRNNPFAGRAKALPQGLAQMDAPVGTLLAFATAPGKLASDGQGEHGVYAAHLAKQLVVPGVPVEIMFRRVREGVVRETSAQQVPWESSSLQGDFTFIPSATQVARPADSVPGAGANAPKADSTPSAPPKLAAVEPRPDASRPSGSRAHALPRAGDTWRYRVQDQFRLGDLFVTARVEEVRANGVAESWTAAPGSQARSAALASFEPQFHVLPGWDLTPPEFAPYLQAAGPLQAGQRFGTLQRRVENTVVPVTGSVEGEEDVVVPAGRFRATKVVLRGQIANALPRGGGRPSPVSMEQVIWYAPDVKRPVKMAVSMRVGGAQQEETTFELIEFKVQ